MAASGRTALRRYPALSWLVGAGLLALLLPSGLTLPQSGPPTLAEFAPVPGQSQGEAADVAELGQPSSQGLGGGSGDGPGGDGTAGAAAASTTVPPPAPGRSGGHGVRKPGTKRCVGKPPRQTEDPLSPTCIAFWEGDNGGSTERGVTGDEVIVTMQVNATSTEGRDPGIRDCAGAPQNDDTFGDTLCKAYQRYFNDRYQTYERTVRFFNTEGIGGPQAVEETGAFAHVSITPDQSVVRKGALSVGYRGITRSRYAQNAPLYISFRQDDEARMDIVGSMICNQLHDRPVRFSSPDQVGKERVFGIVYWDSMSQQKELLEASVEQRCGLKIPAEHQTANYRDGTGLAQLRTRGVTSVILFVANTGHVTASNAAAQQGWFPEWIVPGGPGLFEADINFFGRLANQAQWANAIGVTFDYRRGSIPEQHWYRAYREACPVCEEPVFGDQGAAYGAAFYDAIQLLMTGIQAAGPRLTYENLDRGLHALPPVASPDPFRPAAYFGPGDAYFIKDAMAFRWDPAGRAPGSPSQGCYRLVDDGRRHRAGEWPAGDDGFASPGVCQGDTFYG